MNLRVPLPIEREVVSPSEPVGPITNKMTVEEKRAVADKHREQLARMERKPEVEKLTVNVEHKEISPAPIAPWAKDNKTPTENIEKTPTENIEKTPTENIEKTPTEKIDQAPTEKIEKTPTEKIDQAHEIIECTFDVAIKMMKFIKESGDNRNVHWKIIEN
jgi:hypothetical protein